MSRSCSYDPPRAKELMTEHLSSERRPASNSRTTRTIFRKFEFINVTNPFRYKDAEVRKLVRAHVVKDASAKKKQLQQHNIDQSRIQSRCQEHPIYNTSIKESEVPIISQSSVVNPHVPGIRLATNSLPQSLDPHPSLSPVIYHIASMGRAMWPLEPLCKFNPVSPAMWFNWAISDNALFQALLYTTSSYASLLGGMTESKESIIHLGESIRMLQTRMEGEDRAGFQRQAKEIRDGAMAAVSCLALTEALRGGSTTWRIHMSGVKQMVDIEGGISSLSHTLQVKIYRADQTGAIHFLTSPFFSEPNSLPLSCTYSAPRIHPRTSKVSSLLHTLPITKSLKSQLIVLSDFSQTLSEIIRCRTIASLPSQIAFLQAAYTLRYDFLSPNSVPTELSDTSHTFEYVLKIGALLYMQATLQEFPMAAVGSKNLVQRLMASVMKVKIMDAQQGNLLVWLLFIGGIEAKGVDREWFVSQLGKLLQRLRMDRWDEAKEAIEGLWWIAKVHEEKCNKLWEEIEVVNDVIQKG